MGAKVIICVNPVDFIIPPNMKRRFSVGYLAEISSRLLAGIIEGTQQAMSDEAVKQAKKRGKFCQFWLEFVARIQHIIVNHSAIAQISAVSKLYITLIQLT